MEEEIKLDEKKFTVTKFVEDETLTKFLREKDVAVKIGRRLQRKIEKLIALQDEQVNVTRQLERSMSQILREKYSYLLGEFETFTEFGIKGKKVYIKIKDEIQYAKELITERNKLSQ